MQSILLTPVSCATATSANGIIAIQNPALAKTRLPFMMRIENLHDSNEIINLLTTPSKKRTGVLPLL